MHNVIYRFKWPFFYLLCAVVGAAIGCIFPAHSAPLFDNNDAAAESSLYGKNVAAGDTPVSVDSSGRLLTNQLPSTPIANVGTGSTGVVSAALAATASVTNYLCNFDVSAVGGTAAIGPITITGLLGGTLTFQLFSTASGVNFGRTYTPCIPASAVNTAITLSTTADATATAVDVDLSGFRQ